MLFWDIQDEEEWKSFLYWIEYVTPVPVEFYLNGITYKFKDQDWLDCFTIGMKAAMQIRGELDDKKRSLK